MKAGTAGRKPDAPTRDNARFVEWRRGASTWSFDTPVTTSITLTAAWEHVWNVFAPADGLTKQCCDAQSNLIFVEIPAD